MNDLKFGYQLYRYGFNRVINGILGVFFFAMGLLCLFSSFQFENMGCVWGIMLLGTGPMMLMQTFYSNCYSAILMTAGKRKRVLQTIYFKMITLISFVTYLVSAMILFLFHEETSFINLLLLVCGVVNGLMALFMTLAYRYFWSTLIGAYAITTGVPFLFQTGFSVIIFPRNCALIFGFLLFALLTALNYVLIRVVYNKPLVKWAMGSILKNAI